MSPARGATAAIAADGAQAVRWEGKSVRADAVAQRMLDMRQAASEDEGQPLTRASVMNLLVYAPNAREASEAIKIVDQLAMRHPSRAIIVAPVPGRRFKLDAEVVLSRHPLASHRLLFERALLRPRGASPEGIDTLVIPLLIPHLQSVLWWLGVPNPADPTLRTLGQICDRLIVDTSRGDPGLLNPLSALPGGPELRGRLVLGDMAWTRLDGFRDTLASVFDEPRRSGYLDDLETVEITGVRRVRSAPSVSELLFAGWLTSRLGCSQPVRTGDGVSVVVDASGRRAQITFRGRSNRGASPPPLQGVRLAARAGRRRLELALEERRGEGGLELREPGHPVHARTVPLPTPAESEVLSRELARMGRDRVFEDALLSAARIAAAQRV